jgi:hypothetical protein
VGKKKGATAMAKEGEEIVASTKAKVWTNFGTLPLKMTIKQGSTKTRSLIQIPYFQVLIFRATRNLRSRIGEKVPRKPGPNSDLFFCERKNLRSTIKKRFI